MSEEPTKQRDRRQFIAAAARGAFLAVIAAASVVLVRRRCRPSPDDKCVYTGFCRDCLDIDDCRLPQAVGTRRGMTKT